MGLRGLRKLKRTRFERFRPLYGGRGLGKKISVPKILEDKES